MVLKIAYHPELYLGEGIKRKKLDRIKKKLEKNPRFSGVFVIAISRNPSEQLEIYAARQLSRRFHDYFSLYVVGIAASWEEAVLLVKEMTMDCLRERGDCALKEYMRC